MLSIVPGREVLSLLFQPIDHRIGILLHRGSKDDEIVPTADSTKEVVTVRTLVDIVENGVLWGDV